jgi:ComF family protein
LRGYQRYYRVNRSAVQYNDAMRELLARFKYRGDQQLAPLFGMMLYHGYRHLTDVLQRPVFDAFDCLTYVPVSSERLAERGFNQAEEMAVALTRHVNLPIVPLLSRVKATAKQSQKSRTARFLDMRGAFALDAAGRPGLEQAVMARHARLVQQGREPAEVVPQILLIDDVYTTGSTVDQCAATILAGLPTAEICTLTWAR